MLYFNNMGWLFKRKNQNSKFEQTGQLVYLFTDGKVKVNTELTVENNQVAICMVNDKITDQFAPGTYTLNAATMPITARALELYKQSNQKKGPVKFLNCDVYILSLEKLSLDNEKSYKFVILDKKFGRVTASITYSGLVEVAYPLNLLKALRTFKAVINADDAEKIITDIFSEFVSNIIQKENIQILTFKNSPQMANDIIFKKIVEKMKSLGINVIEFNMEKINLSKRLLEAFGDSIAVKPAEPIALPAQSANTTAGNASKRVVLERVGMQGEGDKIVPVKLINVDKTENTDAILNIDSMISEPLAKVPDFKLKLDDLLSGANIEQSVPIAENKFCRQCGKQLSMEDAFCSKCGKKVEITINRRIEGE